MRIRSRALVVSFVVVFCTLAAIGGPLLGAPGHGEDVHTEEHAHETDPAENRAGGTEEAPYEVELKTHPSPGKIVPDGDKTELMFTVKNDGKTVEDVEFSYRLYAPPKTFWFGTDFPIVEGTQLLSGTVQAAEGNHTVSMILPIRGTYGVKTTVRGPAGVSHEELSFSVSENPQEMLNLAVFLVVLLLIGAVAGYFLSGRSSASVPRFWVLSVLAVAGFLILLAPGTAWAHGEGSWDPHELESRVGVERLRPEADLTVRTFPTPVTVGEMLNVAYDVRVRDTGHPGHEDHEHGSRMKEASDVLVESIFVHSEGGMEMVRQSSGFSDGRGSVSVQLFEGAPHYLVSRFYRATGRYETGGGHEHGHGEEDSAEHEQTHQEKGTQGNEGHEEESVPWEAEMLHHLPPGEYEIHFEESGDPAMKWLLVPEDLEEPLATARHRMRECEDVRPGATVADDESCYNLGLKEEATTYHLNVETGGDYRLFTQHLPREFNLTIERDGHDIDPLRKFLPGKGEYLGRSVERVEVRPVHPPFDDIFKVLVTFLAVIGLGFYVGSRAPGWIGRS